MTTFMSDQYGCGSTPSTPTPMCLHVCSTPAHCATGSPAYDADNYRCTNGLCEFIGCTGDAECAAAVGASYGCHAFEGWGYPVCLPRCSGASDCVIASGGPLYDADNYECDEGFCRWIGCHAAGECESSLMYDDAVCR